MVQTLLPEQVGVTNSTLTHWLAAALTVSHQVISGRGVRLSCWVTQWFSWWVAAPPHATP